MQTLYELTEQYRELLELAEENDSSAFQDTLESLEDAIEDKAEKMAYVMQEIDGDIKLLGDEIKRLQGRKKSLESNLKRMKDYLLDELEKLDKPKGKTARFTIYTQNNPESIEIENEELIPDRYKIPKYTIDRKGIKESLSNGKAIEGVRLTQTKGVRIK